MMIVGLGIDIVDLTRIEKCISRFELRFIQRILGAKELAHIPSQPVNYVAGRFAVKEAAVKALGTGFSQGIGPSQIEAVAGPDGKPQLILHGAARQRADSMGVTRCHVSISHDRASAVAVVILEA